eukprot:TRINITY_DN306_c0_g2_i1.p1 TRINITY_DN306_c0_g2~~TRINITY_DN306_c0_g2_i1.p1  ORF type:complete len:677 (-),score=202.59 TRINITY_DN306_c0_g2_i1:182-2191(-)
MSSEKAISTIRILAADTVEGANSGHPGAPIGMAPMAYALFTQHLRFNPKNAEFVNRDRFVLSNGHASALLYTMLHLTGYESWTLDVLKNFRQLGSPAAGHPENHYEGIEVTTGPLGQGISNAVGLAIAQEHLAATYNEEGFPLFDNYTYVFCGDGCLQEGISSEASSLAGHLGLGKLIVLYDDNKITIDGSTDKSFTEDVTMRYESYGWQVLTVEDGNNDWEAISAAIEEAKAETTKPTMIRVKTIIGFGSSKQGTYKAHGSPLGSEDLANVKKLNGFNPEESYVVDDEIRAVFDKTESGAQLEEEWNALFAAYQEKFPQKGAELARRFAGELPENWEDLLPSFTTEDKSLATRVSSGNVENILADGIPELIGGSADLNPSCFTYINSSDDFQKDNRTGRNIRFGVREHAMAAICNGLAAYGANIIPFCSTFFKFIEYALGAVNMTALSGFQVIYVFTHDSIGLGEDGPTHQPIEKSILCRAHPNLQFIRPYDSNEVSGAWALALKARHTPTVFSLARGGSPNLPTTSKEGTQHGAYIVYEPEGDLDVIIVGTGLELKLAYDAAKGLEGLNARAVSFPCWEAFEQQTEEYKQSIFPAGVPVLSVEALTTAGWEKYAHASIGMTTFGASGKASDLFKHFGFTVENVSEKAKTLVEFYKNRPVPHLLERPF